MCFSLILFFFVIQKEKENLLIIIIISSAPVPLSLFCFLLCDWPFNIAGATPPPPHLRQDKWVWRDAVELGNVSEMVKCLMKTVLLFTAHFKFILKINNSYLFLNFTYTFISPCASHCKAEVNSLKGYFSLSMSLCDFHLNIYKASMLKFRK